MFMIVEQVNFWTKYSGGHEHMKTMANKMNNEENKHEWKDKRFCFLQTEIRL